MKPNKHFVLGLVGGSGTGKTYIGRYIASKLQGLFIEADLIGHDLLLETSIKASLIETFGDAIITEGEINRKALGAIVFNKQDQLDLLNEIMHEAMYQKIAKLIMETPKKFIVLEAAVMIESKLYNLVDQLWYLEADKGIKVSRLTKHRSIEANKALSMIELSRKDYMNYADIKFDTTDGLEAFKIRLISRLTISRRIIMTTKYNLAKIRWVITGIIIVMLLAGCSDKDNKVTDNASGDSQTITTDTAVDTNEEDDTESTTDEVPSTDEDTVVEVKEVIPTYGGVLRVALEAPQSLNPVESNIQSVQQILGLIYEPLFSIDSTLKPQKKLVESYELSQDGKSLTIVLKEGIQFHNGDILTTEDVVFFR